MDKQGAALSPPTLSVIIPTQGRASLARTLESLSYAGLSADDQVLVMGDGKSEEARRMVKEAQLPTRAFYHATKPVGDWGNTPRNVAIESYADGDYLVFLDDDDVAVADSYHGIRDAAATFAGRPLMFRFRTPWGVVLWRKGAEGHVAHSMVGGHCGVFPRVRAARWGTEYAGDFVFLRDTLAGFAPEEVVWVDHVVAICRPEEGPPWK